MHRPLIPARARGFAEDSHATHPEGRDDRQLLHASLDELNAFRSPAQQRLIFEEFFLFQCGLVLRKRRASDEVKPRAVVITDEIRESARRVLPFRLTGDQKKVIGEIVADMNRILEIDEANLIAVVEPNVITGDL